MIRGGGAGGRCRIEEREEVRYDAGAAAKYDDYERIGGERPVEGNP